MSYLKHRLFKCFKKYFPRRIIQSTFWKESKDSWSNLQNTNESPYFVTNIKKIHTLWPYSHLTSCKKFRLTWVLANDFEKFNFNPGNFCLKREKYSATRQNNEKRRRTSWLIRAFFWDFNAVSGYLAKF